ncbi:mitochondrial transcription rescue factor 1 [Manduca sexta]|uniref:mitochondrial transcription rescue factor 1 n=1 Tax=Manduca sexta TaxID=7130 RepID=UPI0018905F20|nr:mitochondrial transcription rescue factor 1 [Manduca sexta]
MSLCRRMCIPILGLRNLQREITLRTLCNIANKNINITSTKGNCDPVKVFYNSIRLKSKKAKYDSDDEDDKFDDDDTSLTKDSKVVKFSTTSMRADVILKSGLGIARNKIEQSFYECKIRINGKKLSKKSATVRPGDEVDVIKMVSPNNPEHLYISRVEVINVVPKEENIAITARRFKNLLIENYDEDPYKGRISENDS